LDALGVKAVNPFMAMSYSPNSTGGTLLLKRRAYIRRSCSYDDYAGILERWPFLTRKGAETYGLRLQEQAKYRVSFATEQPSSPFRRRERLIYSEPITCTHG
jgi:hypothetical protein